MRATWPWWSGTPHIKGFVKAAGGQLIVVVGDIRSKIGGDAVGAHQDLVLGLLLGAILGLFLVYSAVLGSVLRTAVHHSAILCLIAGAQLQQLIHHSHYCAGVVEGALVEPHIVIDAVLAQVPLQVGDVLGHGIGYQSILQSGKAHSLSYRASPSRPWRGQRRHRPVVRQTHRPAA